MVDWWVLVLCGLGVWLVGLSAIVFSLYSAHLTEIKRIKSDLNTSEYQLQKIAENMWSTIETLRKPSPAEIDRKIREYGYTGLEDLLTRIDDEIRAGRVQAISEDLGRLSVVVRLLDGKLNLLSHNLKPLLTKKVSKAKTKPKRKVVAKKKVAKKVAKKAAKKVAMQH